MQTFHQPATQGRQPKERKQERQHKGSGDNFWDCPLSHSSRHHADGHISGKLSLSLPNESQGVGKYAGNSKNGKQHREAAALISQDHRFLLQYLYKLSQPLYNIVQLFRLQAVPDKPSCLCPGNHPAIF